jgi:hypothetical protein
VGITGSGTTVVGHIVAASEHTVVPDVETIWHC